jgi:lipopolysaccharide transport system permease protein
MIGIHTISDPLTWDRRALRHFRDLLRELVVRDLKLRYKRSFLGMGWSLLNPLAQLLVFLFVFRSVLPIGFPDYSSFLFNGIIAWGWFQAAIHQASGSIVENGELIKQPGFPAVILPAVTVITHLIHFLIAVVVLVPLLVLGGHRPSPPWLLLPIVIAAQAVLSLGLGYLVAALQVTFRDTQYTVGVLLMLGFYLTPVFYDPASVPEHYRLYYDLNPLVHLLGAYRGVLLRGELPGVRPLAIVAGWSVLSLVFGLAVFRRASHHFVEEI